MNPNKALWEKGNFTRIAEGMRESGEALVADIGIERGMQVLDLGSGDGTTAIPAARQGADVLGVDMRRTSSKPGTAGRRRKASRTSASRRGTLRTSKVSATIRSTRP
jgi:cyclopropane fatty-acyl-phospholipid synthase-like methyltransferase